MTHFLKSPKSVFTAILLSFQVQLFIAPTFSFANEKGAEIIQKPQEESEVVEPINPEEELEKLVGLFKEEIGNILTNAQGDMKQIDTLLEEAKEKVGQIEKTLIDAQEDVGELKETLTKPVEEIEETLTDTQTKADKTREDIDDLVPKVSEIQDTIQGFYGFIVILAFLAFLLGFLGEFLWDFRHPILNWVFNLLRLENRMNQKIDENRKELEDKIKDLESKVSKIQGKIQTNRVVGLFLGVIVLLIILSPPIVKTLNPTESTPKHTESHQNQELIN